MFRFFVKRVLFALLTLFAISVTVFGLFFLGPADPASSMCGQKNCTPAQHQIIVKAMELDQPVVTQYAHYMKGIFAGREIGSGSNKVNCTAPCLGVNFRTYESVTNIVVRTLPVTVSVVVGGLVVYVLFGVGLGMISAVFKGTSFDRMATSLSLFFASNQIFALGSALMLLLVYTLKIFPQPHYTPLLQDPLAWLGGMLVPWITLGLINSALYTRLSRAQMIETLSEDFVRTARAKGLPMGRVYFRHALRAAITPIVTIAGVDLGGQLGGAPITETTFSLPGMGRQAVQSVFAQQLSVVMGTVLIASVFIVIANITVDMLYAVIDPRVKLGA